MALDNIILDLPCTQLSALAILASVFVFMCVIVPRHRALDLEGVARLSRARLHNPLNLHRFGAFSSPSLVTRHFVLGRIQPRPFNPGLVGYPSINTGKLDRPPSLLRANLFWL